MLSHTLILFNLHNDPVVYCKWINSVSEVAQALTASY